MTNNDRSTEKQEKFASRYGNGPGELVVPDQSKIETRMLAQASTNETEHRNFASLADHQRLRVCECLVIGPKSLTLPADGKMWNRLEIPCGLITRSVYAELACPKCRGYGLREALLDECTEARLTEAMQWVWRHQVDICLMDHAPSVHLSWTGPEGCRLDEQSDKGNQDNPDVVAMLLQAVDRAKKKQTKFEKAFKQ